MSVPDGFCYLFSYSYVQPRHRFPNMLAGIRLCLVWHCNLVDCHRRSESLRRLEKAQLESRLTPDASCLGPGNPPKLL